jgi:Transglycosylase SLT domain
MRASRAWVGGLVFFVGLAVADNRAAVAASLVSENAAMLDRMAVAIDGAESSYGADARMWRPEPDGPQGPMQVSAAAAADVGGGDRFDPIENRMLGRAYLARLYRRYANWADAVAAYNWGPGNMDVWINSGRPSDKFPVAVSLYRVRVLFGPPAAGGAAVALGHHVQPRRPLADRLHPSRDSLAVERLYSEIITERVP